MKVGYYVDQRKKNADGKFGVYLRITADDKKRFTIHSGLTTCYNLVNGEFDALDTRSKAKTASLKQKMAMCEKYGSLHYGLPAQELRHNLCRILNGAGEEDENRRPLSFYFKEYVKTHKNKPQTDKLYMLSARTIEEYDPKANLENITAAWLEKFYEYRTSLGKKTNGIGRTLRDLKAVYNYAITKGYTQRYPFREYVIKREATPHKNLHVQTLRNFLSYQCEDFQLRYRDVFELSIYLWGINMGDLLMLRKEDYKDGYISYDRKKTGRSIRIKVTPRAEEIIKRYAGKEYLLSFMEDRVDYHSFLSSSNEALKKIGKTFANGKKTIGEALMPNISSNYARHTVATLAAEIGIPMSTVSMSLGHSMKGGATVTATYVAFQQWMVDDAIEDVIDYIHSGKDAKTWMRDKRLKDSGIQQMMSEMLSRFQQNI